MKIRVTEYIDAIEHLPAGGTLVFHNVRWSEYVELIEDVAADSHVRIQFDSGRLEIVSPLPEHEEFTRLIERVIQVVSEEADLHIQSYGSATWQNQRLRKGVEPDGCYYVGNVAHVIGKHHFDLEVDPPPDIVVEIDTTRESRGKFTIYAALGVPEIWHYDGDIVRFYKLDHSSYAETFQSSMLPHLTSIMLMELRTASQTSGHTVAVRTFRAQFRSKLSSR